MKNLLSLFLFAMVITPFSAQILQGADMSQIGMIKPDGTVYDESNKVAGKIKKDGMVTNKSSIIIGYIKEDGSIENESHKLVGFVKADGTIEDAEKKVTGFIKDGVVTDKNNETIGYAKNIPVKWAAAYFFFLF
jgi:hypothetical protein